MPRNADNPRPPIKEAVATHLERFPGATEPEIQAALAGHELLTPKMIHTGLFQMVYRQEVERVGDGYRLIEIPGARLNEELAAEVLRLIRKTPGITREMLFPLLHAFDPRVDDARLMSLMGQLEKTKRLKRDAIPGPGRRHYPGANKVPYGHGNQQVFAYGTKRAAARPLRKPEMIPKILAFIAEQGAADKHAIYTFMGKEYGQAANPVGGALTQLRMGGLVNYEPESTVYTLSGKQYTSKPQKAFGEVRDLAGIHSRVRANFIVSRYLQDRTAVSGPRLKDIASAVDPSIEYSEISKGLGKLRASGYIKLDTTTGLYSFLRLYSPRDPEATRILEKAYPPYGIDNAGAAARPHVITRKKAAPVPTPAPAADLFPPLPADAEPVATTGGIFTGFESRPARSAPAPAPQKQPVIESKQIPIANPATDLANALAPALSLLAGMFAQTLGEAIGKGIAEAVARLQPQPGAKSGSPHPEADELLEFIKLPDALPGGIAPCAATQSTAAEPAPVHPAETVDHAELDEEERRLDALALARANGTAVAEIPGASAKTSSKPTVNPAEVVNKVASKISATPGNLTTLGARMLEAVGKQVPTGVASNGPHEEMTKDMRNAAEIAHLIKPREEKPIVVVYGMRPGLAAQIDPAFKEFDIRWFMTNDTKRIKPLVAKAQLIVVPVTCMNGEIRHLLAHARHVKKMQSASMDALRHALEDFRDERSGQPRLAIG